MSRVTRLVSHRSPAVLRPTKPSASMHEHIYWEKKPDQEEDEDNPKEKTLKEDLQEFWNNPRNRKIILFLLGAGLLTAAMSKNIRDIIGVEFFLYPKIGVAELESLLQKREIASIRILAFTGDFNDEYKALLVTNTGKKRVFNIGNPDSFIHYISDIQSRSGISPSDQTPFKIDYKTPLYKNLNVSLQVLYHVMFAAMLGFTVIMVRRFIKDMKGNISGRSRPLELT